MIPIQPFLLVFLIASALAVCLSKNLIASVVIYTSFSTVLSIMWILLAAPDISITEAAVCTGISGVLFFVALKRIGITDAEYGKKKLQPKIETKDGMPFDATRKKFRFFLNTLYVTVCGGFITVLIYTASQLPPLGHPANPPNNEVPRRFIEQGIQDTGALNAVSSMLWSYRSFDTFGEACVLFAAVCVILILLRGGGVSLPAEDSFRREMEEPRQDMILKNISFLLVAIIMIFGFYALVNGHITPGGGFSGGAILGATLVLFASAYGTKRSYKFMNHKVFCRTVSITLSIYALIKGYVFFIGANGLPSPIPLGTPGNLLSGGFIPVYNIAVGIIVACTMYAIYILFSGGDLEADA